MKYIKILIAIATLSLLFISCEDDKGTGAGDAVVSFKSDSIFIKENMNFIRVPVTFTGEPKSFPIVISVSITSEIPGEESIDLDKLFTITESSIRINKDNTSSFEVLLMDNLIENEDRPIRFKIESVKGATLSPTLNSCVVVIMDNDKNPYEKLQGDWSFTASCSGTNGETPFNIAITGGSDKEEIDANFEKKYVINGFNAYDFLVWELNYDGDAGVIKFKPKQTIATPAITGNDYWVLNTRLVATSSVSETQPIEATWSSDFNTITFDVAYGISWCSYNSGMVYAGNYDHFTNVVLRRAGTSAASTKALLGPVKYELEKPIKL